MLWLICIAAVWASVCAVAVALCVMARRGDEYLEAARAVTVDLPADVAWVATLAEPEAAPAEAPGVARPARHTRV